MITVKLTVEIDGIVTGPTITDWVATSEGSLRWPDRFPLAIDLVQHVARNAERALAAESQAERTGRQSVTEKE